MNHQDYLINSVQEELTLEGYNYSRQDIENAINSLEEISQDLIVTNLPTCVFKNSHCQQEFENLFRKFDSDCQFAYLPSFSRAKVLMSSPEVGLYAKSHLDKTILPTHDESTCTVINNSNNSSTIGVYFWKKPTELLSSLGVNLNSSYLAPPQPNKLYLLSPPSSPPVGWEPIEEAEPCINYDLLAALSKLAPGETHELHASFDDKPAILLTPCVDEEEDVQVNYWQRQEKLKIEQTKCPFRPT